MKILSLLLFFSSIQMVCQNWEITYESSINFDVLRNIDNTEKGKADLQKFKNDAENLFSTLLINEDYSYFAVNPSLNNESKSGINLVKVLMGGNYFKKMQSNETFQIPRYFSNILVRVPTDEWTITEEQKTILGHAVFKATNTEIVTSSTGVKNKKITSVWFAPSIPASSGPKNYNSLPGLVLETESSNGLVFKATKVENSDNLTIKIPDYQIISQEDFFVQLKQRRESFRN